MSAPMLALLAISLGAAEPGDITPRGAQTAAELQHRGDRRSYVRYQGKPLRFDVEAPATVEVAVRVVFKPNRKRAKVQLRIRADRQTLLDQSQVLGLDRRAKGEEAVSRPLIALADIPPGPRRFAVELKGQNDAVAALIVAVSAVKIAEVETTAGASGGEDLMVPGLVGLDPGAPETAAETAEQVPTPAPIPAPVPEVEAAPPYQPSRFLAVELNLAVGLGVPGVELGARYYLPLWDERISLGLRAGYGYAGATGLSDPLVVPTRVELSLHLLPVVALAELELLRQPAGPGVLFAGLRGEGGVVPFFGALREQTLLAGGEQHLTETPLGGLTWCAGGALLAGFDTPAGAFVADLGYLYAPEATAQGEGETRRSVSTRVLGPRLDLGYRLSF